jgi:hypothetical protein
MRRSVAILLGDIAEAAELIQRYVAGVTFDSFVEDPEKQDAVLRRLEIIGEAVKALPQETETIIRPCHGARSPGRETSWFISTSAWTSTSPGRW